MSTSLAILVYCSCIVAASLLGGYLPRLLRLTHTRIQLLMSAVGGLMLGIGLFHLLPHAVNPEVSLDRAIWWMMLGLLTTFILMRVFHAHEHAPPAEVVDDDGQSHDTHHSHEETGECGGHGHHHAGHDHHAVSGSRHRWIGIYLGLSLHTLLDGVALGAGVLHDAAHTSAMILPGFAVFLGVLLHKPLDSLSITTLMSGAGWSTRFQQWVNFSYALMCPIGAALFYLGVQQSQQQDLIVGCALAFSAGIFVCISLADLLPELQFHAHDRLKLTAALLFGVVLAYAIGYLEPAHVHNHPIPAANGDHDHSNHDHSDHDEHHHRH